MARSWRLLVPVAMTKKSKAVVCSRMSSTRTFWPRLSSASCAAARANSRLRLGLVLTAGCVIVRATHAPFAEGKEHSSMAYRLHSIQEGGKCQWKGSDFGQGREEQEGTEGTEGKGRQI